MPISPEESPLLRELPDCLLANDYTLERYERLKDQGRRLTGWAISILLGLPLIVFAFTGEITIPSAWILSITGALLMAGRKRRLSKDALTLLQTDKRTPIIYLRSFKTEKTYMPSSYVRNFRKNFRRSVFKIFRDTYEERLADALKDIGPIIAIGNPMDHDPALGPAKLYLQRKDDWQPAIEKLIKDAALVLLHVGTSPGVLWELRQVQATIKPTKFIICLPVKMTVEVARQEYESFRELSAKTLPRPLPEFEAEALFIYFDSDWGPHLLRSTDEQPLEQSSGAESDEVDALSKAIFSIGTKFQLAIKLAPRSYYLIYPLKAFAASFSIIVLYMLSLCLFEGAFSIGAFRSCEVWSSLIEMSIGAVIFVIPLVLGYLIDGVILEKYRERS